MIIPGFIGKSKSMTKDNLFLEGKDPLQVLWDQVEGNEKDNKNNDSQVEQEQ